MEQQPLDSPFGFASTAMEVIDGIDLSGRVAVITGGASGIGVETARALAHAGARLWLPVRNREKGEAVAAALRADTGNDAVFVDTADLFDLATIRAFVDRFLAAETRLDLLINNAGIMACPLARSPEGWESQLATNHFGHFVLTLGLLPALRAAAPARIVNLSSLAHRLSPVHLDDLHFERREYHKWLAYGQAKTANVLFTVGLEARLAAEGIHAFAVHPGGIMTGLQKHLAREEMEAMGWFEADGRVHEGFKSVQGGAATTVWAATSPLLAQTGGLYLEDCNVAAPATPEVRFAGVHAHALDRDAAERLWVLSEEATGAKLDRPL